MSLAQLLNPTRRGGVDDDGARSIDIGSQDSESNSSEEAYTDQDDGDSGHGYYSEERDEDDDEDGPAQSLIFIDDGPAQSFIDHGERTAEEREGNPREHRSVQPQLSGTLVDRWRERGAPPGAPPQPWAPCADTFAAAQHSAPGPSSRHEAVERWIAGREEARGGEASDVGYRSAPEQLRGIREERAAGRDRDRGKGRARPWGSVRAESFGKDGVEPEPAYRRPPPPPWFAGREPTPYVREPRMPGPVLPETRRSRVGVAPRIKVRSASPEAGSSASPEAGSSAALGMGGPAMPEADGGVSDSGGSSGNSPLIYVARARTASINVSAAKRDGQRFPCDVCDKTFNRPTDALRHMNTVHEEEGGEWSKLSTCDVCGKKLARPDSLKRHRDVKHPSAGPPPKRRRGESGSVSAGSVI